MVKFSVGDLVLLKKTYRGYGKTAVIISVDKSEFSGKDGWISFAYQIVTESGHIAHITESCIEKVLKEEPTENQSAQ